MASRLAHSNAECRMRIAEFEAKNTSEHRTKGIERRVKDEVRRRLLGDECRLTEFFSQLKERLRGRDGVIPKKFGQE